MMVEKSSYERILGQADQFAKPADSVSKVYSHKKKILETNIAERYREFFGVTKKQGLQEVEQLIPYIELPFVTPVAQEACKNIDDIQAQNLLSQVPPNDWGYYYPLSSKFSTFGSADNPIPHAELAKLRAEHRMSFIWGGIEKILGSIKECSVLDIACNWGGFAVEAKLRGATSVSAFDIRPENILKAKLLANHFEVEVDYRTSDLFTYPTGGDKFDIVLNLGLMYHMSQPWEMMLQTYNMTRTIAVIDTVVHREPFSGFILGDGTNAVDHASTAVGMELHPTYRGLIDLAKLAGFRNVYEIKGLPAENWLNFDSDPYGNGTRRCIIAIK